MAVWKDLELDHVGLSMEVMSVVANGVPMSMDLRVDKISLSLMQSMWPEKDVPA